MKILRRLIAGVFLLQAVHAVHAGVPQPAWCAGVAGQAPVTSLDGRKQGHVRALYDVPLRQSFLAVLEGLDELWEISYNPNAESLYDGLVHDYRMGEGLARSGYLGVRRIPLATSLLTPLQQLYLSSDQHWLISVAASPSGAQGRVISLDARRDIGTAVLQASPTPGTSLDLSLHGRNWHATPLLADPLLRERLLARYCKS